MCSHGASVRKIFEEDKAMKEVVFFAGLVFVSTSVFGMNLEKSKKESVKQTTLNFSKVNINKGKTRLVDQDSSNKKIKKNKVYTDRNKEKIRELENQLNEFATQEEVNAEEIKELNGKLDESLKEIENLKNQLVVALKENEQLTQKLQKIKESNQKLNETKQIQSIPKMNLQKSEIENLKRQLIAKRNLRKGQVQISQSLRTELVEQNKELEYLRQIVYQRKLNNQPQVEEKKSGRKKSKYDELSDSSVDSE